MAELTTTSQFIEAKFSLTSEGEKKEGILKLDNQKGIFVLTASTLNNTKLNAFDLVELVKDCFEEYPIVMVITIPNYGIIRKTATNSTEDYYRVILKNITMFNNDTSEKTEETEI